MATLQATSMTPSVTATNILSPIALNTGSLSLHEYSGSVYLGLNSTVDLITNNSGYARMTGYGYFSALTTAANTYGYFSFGISRYGLLWTNLISYSSGNYALSNYQNPSNVDINSLRFTNSYSPGTFYFSLIIQGGTVSTSSATLTRIK